MRNTQIMINFLNHIVNTYDDDFEIHRVVMHEEYDYRYKIITRFDDHTLSIMHTQTQNLCVRWDDDVYEFVHTDREWRLVGTFY